MEENLWIICYLFSTVLVPLACYSGIPYTACLINDRYLFLTILEAGKSKIKEP